MGTSVRHAVVTAIVVLVATSGCGDADPATEADVPIGPSAVHTETPPPATTTSAAPPDFAPKVSTADLRAGLVPSSKLGSAWNGPDRISDGFPKLDNYVQNCSQSSGLTRRHEALKPRAGGFAFYDNVDPNVVLSTVSTGVGVDTIARASAYLAFLRTLPQACPTGKVLKRYPFDLAEVTSSPAGDEAVRLRMTVALPDGPLLLDLGYVRQGGLVVVFYGEQDQVDEFLSTSFNHARAALAGNVPGI